jgi:hypothetical protein
MQSIDCPFFSLCLLILETHLENKDRHGPESLNQMLNVIEKNAYLPQEIRVKREEGFRLFEVLVPRLGLKMKQGKRLKQLQYVKESMDSYFSSTKM